MNKDNIGNQITKRRIFKSDSVARGGHQCALTRKQIKINKAK